jgi:hypothetical protein
MENEYIELPALDLVKKELVEKKYRFKRKMGFVTLALTILFICFGTVTLFYGSLTCLIFYIPSLIVLSVSQGVLIDAVQNKVCDYSSILGYKYEKLYYLEDFTFVLVSTSSTVARNGFESISHVLYLYSKNKDKQRNLLIAIYSDREEAVENGHKIGALINFPVKVNKFN